MQDADKRKLKRKRSDCTDELGGMGGLEELLVDVEGAFLDGGSEVAACLGGVVGVEGGDGVERSQDLRRVRPRFQNLLQLPRQSRS